MWHDRNWNLFRNDDSRTSTQNISLMSVNTISRTWNNQITKLTEHLGGKARQVTLPAPEQVGSQFVSLTGNRISFLKVTGVQAGHTWSGQDVRVWRTNGNVVEIGATVGKMFIHDEKDQMLLGQPEPEQEFPSRPASQTWIKRFC